MDAAVEAVEPEIREAIRLRLGGLRAGGQPAPKPRSIIVNVET
ncbi:MAG: hypothetical protein ACT4N4_15955 [Rhodospirillales bacterium]